MVFDDLFASCLRNSSCVCGIAGKAGQFLCHLITHIVDLAGVDRFLNVLAACDFDMVFRLAQEITEVIKIIKDCEKILVTVASCIPSSISLLHISAMVFLSSAD